MITPLTPAIGLGTPELVLILLVVFLLFGASRLPQLAKALGQSKRAFKDGIDEAEAEAQRERLKPKSAAPAELSAVDDEALFEEARRRAAARRETERS
ncbi:MAG: twin-arginine translocase TatA/TatE family subunit [Acidobacteriota bacterium]|nr:twin-arginine translocase TatA/TatE family subunit [Acidobacteriota bacterium]